MSGWMVRRSDTAIFSPRQHKEMLSLLSRDRCQQTLASSLSTLDPGLGQTFALHQSEICAGAGEGDGEGGGEGGGGQDVCQADGGAPLVCEAQSGRWTLVGLLTWSLSCHSTNTLSQPGPGVFLSIESVSHWILSVQ